MPAFTASDDDVFPRLYSELRDIADRLLRREGVGHTLQPTALLHEAWLKLSGGRRPVAIDKSHYLALAARAMRQVLVDHARKRQAARRGGDAPQVTLGDAPIEAAVPLDEMIALDDALQRLGALDERLAKVVELRFFAGLGEDEVAQVLGVTTRTVQRDWVRARAWLHAELRDAAPQEAP